METERKVNKPSEIICPCARGKSADHSEQDKDGNGDGPEPFYIVRGLVIKVVHFGPLYGYRHVFGAVSTVSDDRAVVVHFFNSCPLIQDIMVEHLNNLNLKRYISRCINDNFDCIFWSSTPLMA